MAGGLTQRQQKLVHEAEQLLHEARYNPDFAEMMKGRGYGEESWAHGEALVATMKAGGRAFERAQSEKFKATNIVMKQREKIWAHSSTLSQSCVSLFQGQTDFLNALGLHARRKDGNGGSDISKPNKTGKIEQVLNWQRNLFEVAQNHTEIASVLSTNGFPPDLLAQNLASVEAMARAEYVQEQTKKFSTQRRAERDDSYKLLRMWLRCAQRIAKLAKKDRDDGGVLG